MDRYAVFGHPIKHSQSPFIHHAFADQVLQKLTYEAIDPGEGNFPTGLKLFHETGGLGANVTSPFKAQAAAAADELSHEATQAGAANTLYWREDGSLFGHNTDGIGLVNDLTQRLEWVIQSKRILILGAGGAVAGILQALLAQNPEVIDINNRTHEKAEALSAKWNHPQLQAVKQTDIEQAYDIVIHGTAAALSGGALSLPSRCINNETLCYDLMYAAEPTAFMRWAEKLGAKMVCDGLGMLVEQAASSFELWRGVRPETESVYQSLRAKITTS